MEYENLLDNAYKVLPETAMKKERFELPKVRGHIQGNKTVVSNWHQIAASLNRPVQHLTKFITKELATPADLKSGYILFGTRIPASRINDKIEKYAECFVICRECGKPDTKLSKEGSFLFMKCMACGSRHSIQSKI